jgi:hypothetical protein
MGSKMACKAVIVYITLSHKDLTRFYLMNSQIFTSNTHGSARENQEEKFVYSPTFKSPSLLLSQRREGKIFKSH